MNHKSYTQKEVKGGKEEVGGGGSGGGKLKVKARHLKLKFDLICTSSFNQ